METLILSKMVDDSMFVVRQRETWLFGKDEKKIKISLFTDTEGPFESIVSTKQVERNSLRMEVQDLKE